MQRLLDLLERDKYSPDKLTCLTNDLIVRTALAVVVAPILKLCPLKWLPSTPGLDRACCPLAVNSLCFKVCTEFAMENGYNEN